MNGVLLAVLLYVVAQLAVGFIVSRKIRSEADYLVAGRRVGLGLALFSIFATWFGAESCVTAAGKFYAEGIVGGITDPFGYGFALVLLGLFFSAPLWKRGLTTLADLFRLRYSPGVERFAALMMAPTSVFWAAAQIRAFGQVLTSASNLDVAVAITLAAAVVIVYTCTGGLMADVITDFIQGIVIIFGLIVLLFVICWNSDLSLGSAWTRLDPAKLTLFSGQPGEGWAMLELWTMAICGSLVAQEVIARVLAARSPEVAHRATLYGGGLYLVVGLIPAVLGLWATQLLPDLADSEHVLPRLAEQYLPTLLYILFIGALVSAILSTVDSTLLAASAIVSHNLIFSWRPGMTDRSRLITARAGVLVFGLMAYALALGAESIFELVQQANGVGSAGVFVLMVFGLYSGKGGARTAMATLIMGLTTWVYGTYIGEWTCTYLVSLGASLATFGTGIFLENTRPA
jgi:SSS family transporter